jgi:hypothetical protein
MAYTVEIEGYTVVCETSEEVVRLLAAVRANPRPPEAGRTAPRATKPAKPVVDLHPEARRAIWGEGRISKEEAFKILVAVRDSGERGVSVVELAKMAGFKDARGLGIVSAFLGRELEQVGLAFGHVVHREKREGGKRWFPTQTMEEAIKRLGIRA